MAINELLALLSPAQQEEAVAIPYRRGEKPKPAPTPAPVAAPEPVAQERIAAPIEQAIAHPDVSQVEVSQSMPREPDNEVIQLLKQQQQQADSNMLVAGASSALAELLFGGSGNIAKTGVQMMGQQVKRKQELENKEIDARLKESLVKLKMKKEKDKDRFKDAMSLRRYWAGRPTTKDTQTLSDAYRKIKAIVESQPSSPGDISLIFNYMKMLDPASTVREGEQATARNARGVPESIRMLWNRFEKGDQLSKEQRMDFASRARTFYQQQLKSQSIIDSQIKRQAQQAGIKDDIVMGFGDAELGKLAKPKSRRMRDQGWIWEWSVTKNKYIPIKEDK